MKRKLLTFVLGLLCCGTATQAQQLTCDDDYNLVGDASLEDECFVLTQNTTGQAGCAWFLNQQDFSMPFSVSITGNFGTNDGGADGICLVFQTASDGICGGTGINIGAGGIPNSFIIELDTWDNGAANGDIPNDHLAININGDISNPIDGPVDVGNIEDGGDYSIDFDWDPATMTYNVNGAGGALSGVFDIINNCFNGETMAWWGVTSSTGGATNRHTVCPGLPPEVIADAVGNLPSYTLPCPNTSLQLDGTNSDQGGDFIYEWETFDGNIVDGDFTLTPTVDMAGTYTLTVTNTTTNCTATSEVTIAEEELIADIFAPDDLDCDLTAVTLFGDGSSSGPNITYSWETFDGNIISTNGSQAIVDAPGTYTLIVTYDDGFFFCEELAEVTIAGPGQAPEAFAVDAILYCEPTSIQLDGTGSSEGGQFGYDWFTSEGNVVADGNTRYPTIDEPGFYTLRVTNLNSFCFEEIEIFVEDGRIAPTATAIVDNQLDCSTGSIVIDGSLSASGPDIIYEWTTVDGNIISGQFEDSPSVDQPGTYTLTVTSTATGCTGETSVEVTRDNSTVVAAVAPPAVITCATTSALLDGSASSAGPDITYTWTTTDGQLLGPTNQETAEADGPGTYTLTVTNTALNCSQTTTVSVMADDLPPSAEAGTAPVFNCGDTSLQLNGSAGGASNLSVQWTTTNGNILSGAATLTPAVGSAGTYQLAVTNVDNGCTATDVVVVSGNAATPVAQAMATDVIDCETTSVVLSGSGSTADNDTEYQWSTTDGQLQGGTTSLSAIALAPGRYQLLVTNSVSGCSSIATVEVVANTTPPPAEAGTATTFRCGDSSQQLDGQGSGTGDDITYNWSTADGSILSGASTLTPSVGSPGTYELAVRDTISGCFSTDQVTVVGDVNIPTVAITVSDTLDCATSSLALDATASDSGPDYTLSWTTANGQFVSGQDGLQPTVAAGGTYLLSITNTANSCNNSASVRVVVDTLSPPLIIAAADTINCSRDTVSLLALGGNPILYNYQWTSTDGQVVGPGRDTTVQVVRGGVYQLRVLNPENACETSAMVNVVQDTLRPQLSLAVPDTLNCARATVDLTSSTQNTTPRTRYQWSTLDGRFFGLTDSTLTTVVAAGNYQLIATNPSNTCADTASITVAINDQHPTADAGDPQILNCSSPTSTLGGSTTSSGSAISYRWSRLAGGNVTDSTRANLTVAQPGSYILLVTDSNNACLGRDTVEVAANFLSPQAAIAPPNVITCTDTLATLDGRSSSGQASLSYRWFTTSGALSGNTDQALAAASREGRYSLEVTDAANGCRDTLTVEVAQDDDFPQVSIATPDILNCSNPTLRLRGNISGMGTLRFSWQTANGRFVDETEQLDPRIDAPGDYQLLVEDLTNNCRAQATVRVVRDTVAPVSSAGSPAILNCTAPSTQLNALADGPGDALTYAWTGPGLPTPTTTPDPLVDQAGSYQLVVTNTRNGCRDTSTVAITEDFTPPSLAIQRPDTLDCERATVFLDATASAQGPNIRFRWSGPGGMLPDTPQPEVAVPGNYTLVLENETNGCRDTSSVLVAIDRVLPNVLVSVEEVINCARTSVALQSVGSDSGPDYRYRWRSTDGQLVGETNLVGATATSGGTYTLEITNLRNACVDSSTVQVLVDTLRPQLRALPAADIDCNQLTSTLASEVQLAGSQPQYSWSTSNGNITSAPDQAVIMVDSAGQYQLVVTNPDNGCQASLGFQVDADLSRPGLNLAVPGLLTCAQPTQTLVPRAVEPLSTYEWTASAGGLVTANPTEAELPVTVPGIYTVEVVAADNGCRNTATVEVQQDTLSPRVLVAPAPPLDCAQMQVQLDATASATGSRYRYRWTTPDGQLDSGTSSLQPTVSQGGTYELLVTDTANGCTATASVNVAQDENLPQVEIASPPLLTCVQTSVVLDATNSSAGLDYRWTTPNGNILSGADGLRPTVDQIGTYELEITDPSNSCRASRRVQVLANRIPPAVNAGVDFELSCDQSAIQLDGSGSDQGANYQYAWTGLAGQLIEDATTLTPGISETGTYQLLVTNTDNGCTAVDEVTVTQDLPIAEVTVVPPACVGEEGSIAVDQVTGGVPPYLYAIDGETLRADQFFTGLNPGDYQLVVEDAGGCIYEELLVLPQPDSFAISFVRDEWEISWGDSVQLAVSSTVPVDSTYRINWLATEWLSCTDCLDPVARPLRTYNYGLELISPAGCRAEAFARILVNLDRPIYFPTAFSPNGDGDNDLFYPFAKVGVVEAITSFQVYNRWGNSVYELTDMQPNDPRYGWDGRFRGEPLNPAVFVYVAEVIFTDGTKELFSGEITLVR